MVSPDKEAFVKVWPRCFLVFLGVVEVIAAIVLIVTEFGNVASNFWTTNVFAGGWCGIIMIAHFFGLFVAACCSPSPPAAFRAVVITIIALVACGVLIGFDAYFIATPSACLLTSSCSTNAVSTSSFSYYFRQSFFLAFNSLSAFSSYTESQAKFLFRTIQLSVGALCFVLCIVYLVIYYVSRGKASDKVSPSTNQPTPYAPPPGARSQQPQYGPRAPQPAPNQATRNQSKRY
ncbi:unnamed protein product [Rotaria socialis]|uniref:Uncharacterized protein n=1 Tax=Rotaria socialis TaxID=392032 RepID=A0A817NS37_9BILA|nr:unnamed protein product [Rotaria socialis]CAF3228244.1 unnamed protein product [Rotaria socialis]CAF3480632.1 unnamed protein product [Rotaria socialis]CAF3525145.1 unnamed protein product [Rotaria socialis]CAF3734601.1 unnamed protein product [Rotaria socialis]